jgi:hypothetical protein
VLQSDDIIARVMAAPGQFRLGGAPAIHAPGLAGARAAGSMVLGCVFACCAQDVDVRHGAGHGAEVARQRDENSLQGIHP